MRILGLVLLIGGFLVRVLTQSASMDTLAWVLMKRGIQKSALFPIIYITLRTCSGFQYIRFWRF
jgi:hypothetical protein